jgi:hypothetical protein
MASQLWGSSRELLLSACNVIQKQQVYSYGYMDVPSRQVDGRVFRVWVQGGLVQILNYGQHQSNFYLNSLGLQWADDIGLLAKCLLDSNETIFISIASEVINPTQQKKLLWLEKRMSGVSYQRLLRDERW